MKKYMLFFLIAYASDSFGQSNSKWHTEHLLFADLSSTWSLKIEGIGGLPSFVPQKIHPGLGTTYSCMFAHNPYGDWYLRIGFNVARQGFTYTRDSMNWGVFTDPQTGQFYATHAEGEYDRLDLELPFTFMKRNLTTWGMYASAGIGLRIGLWRNNTATVNFGNGTTQYFDNFESTALEKTNVIITTSLGVVRPLNTKFDLLIECRYTNIAVPISIKLLRYTAIPFAWGIGAGIQRRF